MKQDKTRHRCIACGRYRYSSKMKKVLPLSWVCRDDKCIEDKELNELVYFINTIANFKRIKLSYVKVNLLSYIKNRENNNSGNHS